MRKTYFQILAAVLLPAFFLACSKETNDNLDEIEKFYVDNPDAIAQVKFVHAYTPLTINGTAAAVTSPTTGAVSGTGFRITMDGNKINGATNTASNTNTLIWGGVYPPTTAYAFLNPGQRNFRFIMNRITSGAYAPIAGDEVFNSTVNLTAGKKYSMFISDPYPAPTTFLIEDNYQEPNPNQYGLRFINLSGDLTARYDCTSLRHGNIFMNVGNKEVKNFTYLTIPAVTDTIYLKTAGTNTIVAQINGFSAASQRVYTIYARGKTGVTNRTPSITSYTNR
jgi:Domain of unknown function (DUF4397)